MHFTKMRKMKNMDLSKLAEEIDLHRLGKEMHDFVCLLHPFCRSITGNGVRESLTAINEHIHITMYEVPTGTRVFDWTVPKEWNIRDAYVKNIDGKRVIDFQESNLHVVGYSLPVSARMGLHELRQHMHTLPDQPDQIPYRTTYYKEDWGFCLSHNSLLSMQDREYEVCIDTTLETGHLTYGECFLQGQSEQEILLSTHICHPSLCNDNLSGIALLTSLAKLLSFCSLYFSYRFLFIPGTIGSITWLARNEARISRIRHGLVVSCVGDPGPLTYKKSRRGNAEIDSCAAYVLQRRDLACQIMDFVPYGYDERQFCSPGFNLPIGCLMRTPYGQYTQYHTSADDQNFVLPSALADSLAAALDILAVLEANHIYTSTNPKCEPQLGRRGLYKHLGGMNQDNNSQLALLWVLNLADGQHTLLDIAVRSGLDFNLLKQAADILLYKGLVHHSSCMPEQHTSALTSGSLV